MKEHDVDVAQRAKLAPAVAAHRHERHRRRLHVRGARRQQPLQQHVDDAGTRLGDPLAALARAMAHPQHLVLQPQEALARLQPAGRGRGGRQAEALLGVVMQARAHQDGTKETGGRRPMVWLRTCRSARLRALGARASTLT
jgi:hypothetical protein